MVLIVHWKVCFRGSNVNSLGSTSAHLYIDTSITNFHAVMNQAQGPQPHGQARRHYATTVIRRVDDPDVQNHGNRALQV